ncbi:3-dehydroquinate synthase, partial [Campylobacter hyointestinalis subsp. lawsonii]
MQINIDLKENSYPVFIDELKALNIGGKVAIITNSK